MDIIPRGVSADAIETFAGVIRNAVAHKMSAWDLTAKMTCAGIVVSVINEDGVRVKDVPLVSLLLKSGDSKDTLASSLKLLSDNLVEMARGERGDQENDEKQSSSDEEIEKESASITPESD